MKRITKKRKNLFRNEKGQGMVEYILLLVVVIGIVMAFRGKIADVIKGKTDQVGEGINTFNVQGE